MLKQNRANSMLPAMTDSETPQRGRNMGTLPHNDSIYQSEVNQSMNSGLGLTPKRMQFEQQQKSPRAGRHKGAPFGAPQTEQKSGGQQFRVPPILLANEHHK